MNQQEQSSLGLPCVPNALQIFPETEAGKKAQYTLAYNLGMPSKGYESNKSYEDVRQYLPFSLSHINEAGSY